jgi:hypothetical protein
METNWLSPEPLIRLYVESWSSLARVSGLGLEKVNWCTIERCFGAR